MMGWAALDLGRYSVCRRSLIVLAALMSLFGWVGVSPAFGETPFWAINQTVAPRYIPPGGEGVLVVAATNLGDKPAEGQSVPIDINVALPPGLTATSAEASTAVYGAGECLEPSLCTFAGSLPPYEPLHMLIHVKDVSDVAASLFDEVTVSGGAARIATVREPITISSAPVKFGVEAVELQAFNEDGSLDTQAGSHPFELTTMLGLNEEYSVNRESSEPIAHVAGALAKDLHFLLPAGLVGNPQVVPQCSEEKFTTYVYQSYAPDCPENTVIGVASVTFSGYANEPNEITFTVPVYNLVPSAGEPARFAFAPVGVDVYLDTSVRTGRDYGVTVSVHNISQAFGFVASQVTFWGDPGDPLHNSSRGPNCLLDGVFGTTAFHPCESPAGAGLTPFLTLPTSCEGPLSASVQADSWEEPSKILEGSYTLHDNAHEAVGMSGCNQLPFEPSISLAPDGQAGSTPTGLTVGIHVPQQAALNPTGLSEADVKDTTVTLPEGVALNAAAADGLLACSAEQVGFEGREAGSGRLSFSPGPASCPEDSKIGTVTINTPLLPNQLEGAVYLASQDANPFGSLVAMYLIAEDPVSGTRIKLAGEVKLDEHTGQVVSTFLDTPQLPFEDLHLHFFGTARAPLSTPALCGGYVTHAAFGPWSGTPAAEPTSEFQVTSGPNGGPCTSTLPFSPSLTAGTTSIQAGGFSPFTMTVTREDGQQNIKGIDLHMPNGLSGLLTGVELCGEAQADAGTCGSNSLIGETTVSVGLGGDPYSVRGGRVYITGPYEGAPFGISVVVPAKAGPYDLGQVVVRGTIRVDPISSALTVTTNTTGPYSIPHILDGIPLEIKHVNFVTTRPGFTFNPTNCDPLKVAGSVSSVEGSSSPVAVPFQVTNCAALGFKPRFLVSTSGKTSRRNGASLTLKVVRPSGPGSGQANFAKVKIDLPKLLPTRLTTLQKACTAAQFNANPAGCPSASIVGHVKVVTPLLPVPLEGPAYFVSHGGEEFPNLIFVLQGYGLTLDVVSATFIGKGITSGTLKAVPDAPFTSFELTLPQGPDSALAANGNLCSVKHGLHMPTAFTAQNGIVIHQSTPIAVTGCTKKKTEASKHAHKKKR